MTTDQLINRLPSPLLNSKSPVEVLYNKVPSYSHLRSFGCLCYASTLIRMCEKFSPQARACVFMGYPIGIKAYKLLDIESYQVFHS